MNRLTAELQRLYFLTGQEPVALAEGALALEPTGADGKARALLVDFGRAADWESVARLYAGVQEDFDLPAPAISVSGWDGYRVWFSLAVPVPVEEARGFLDGLRRKYLAEIPPARLKFHPGLDGSAAAARDLADLPPALHGETGKWSAFIDPAMGSMFADEPGLEMAPNPERQADLLAGFESIKAGDFERAMKLLAAGAISTGSPPAPSGHPGSEVPGQPGSERMTLNVGGNFNDPKSFLLAVMNDPAANPGLRIEAAKALLPYFEKSRS